MINQIGDWIDQQRPGGYIHGASRLGKSRCIQWFLMQVLVEKFGSLLPLIIWNRRAESQSSESFFWHQLLMASNFEFLDPLKPLRKSEAIFLCKNRFISIAKNANRNYVILLIDEAQDLTLREWKWLVGLQNALDYEGFLLSVFSVGTHQLGYQHEYLASTGNAHVAARFMAAHARFHGIQTVGELEYVLNGYDEDSEWPAGSGISFLKYFSPRDFDADRRLANRAGLFWKALLELSPKKRNEFPMQHIARTIEAALFRLANGGNWDEVMSYESLLESISRTNFSDHMRIIASAN
ncbi:ATP-binding protein [Undibacterium sp. LX40W]|nr:ATP-binding protein [Undibacterium sp. LX40W]